MTTAIATIEPSTNTRFIDTSWRDRPGPPYTGKNTRCTNQYVPAAMTTSEPNSMARPSIMMSRNRPSGPLLVEAVAVAPVVGARLLWFEPLRLRYGRSGLR